MNIRIIILSGIGIVLIKASLKIEIITIHRLLVCNILSFDEIYFQKARIGQYYWFLKKNSYIFVAKLLANIIMNQKKAEYIALYSLVFGIILVFGILIRQFVLSKGIDDFSSTVAFFSTVVVLTALYASLQISYYCHA